MGSQFRPRISWSMGRSEQGPIQPVGADRIDLSRDVDRHSGMRIAVGISLEYERERGNTNDKFESRASALGLMLLGGLFVFIILWFIVPKIAALI